MKKTLLALVALAAVGTAAPALGADLGARSYYNKAPAYAAPIYNWTGFYIGGHIGGAFSGSDNLNGTVLSNYAAGFLGGVQVGADWQFAPSWVLGLEGQYSWLSDGGLRATYPGGFVASTEHVTIRRKIKEFEGGVFVQTVPSGNYRCLPAPYERACMIASVFKRNKVKGKVLVLDANPEITIKKDGFHAAFGELYKGYIEWLPSKGVTGVDLEKRIIKTEFDEYPFDDAAIYANVRGSTLIEHLGLMAPTSKSNQKEANIDTRYYNIIGDPHVYVTGDSRPHPYSKSANTSNTEGHYMAQVLAARAQGKEIPWVSPRTICYSMVNANPMEAISVDAGYDYSAEKDIITGFSKDTRTFENRDAAKGQATLEWARGIYRDMFTA